MTQICVKCKRDWNVSDLAEIPRRGYVCPPCRRAEEKEENCIGETYNRQPRYMGERSKKI